MNTTSYRSSSKTATPIALTIAGSDSGGGAGIQADLKTFSALDVYGCSVITALTAQNTQGVQGIIDVPPDFIRQQMDSVFSDIAVNAVKIGMLSQQSVIEAVVSALETYQPTHLIVDPVMVATSGDVLLQQNAIDALRTLLIPKATLITPNLAEAAQLLNWDIPHSLEEMIAMIEPLQALGAKAVLLKGGHLPISMDTSNQPSTYKAVDLFFDGAHLHTLESAWVKTKNTHGTGCTLSSAITALLARDLPLIEAVRGAKSYIAATIAHADQLYIGHGHGPVHHFYRQW